MYNKQINDLQQASNNHGKTIKLGKLEYVRKTNIGNFFKPFKLLGGNHSHFPQVVSFSTVPFKESHHNSKAGHMQVNHVLLWWLP